MGAAEEDYLPGDVLRFPTPDGQADFAGVVREVDDEALLCDFNHPLAGQALRFEVQLIGVL
jgi:FKBP-type peptidyl-prolyl cis-trans isomerase SlpA